MQWLYQFLEPLLLRSRVGPPILSDLRLAVPGFEKTGDGRRAIELLPRDTQLRSELARGFLNVAACAVIDGAGKMFLELLPELLQRRPRGLRIRACGFTRREFDVLVPTDGREG